ENRQLESAFVNTFMDAAHWIATGDDLRRAADLCISENCRRQLASAALYWNGDMQVSLSQSENGETFVNFAQYTMPLAKARDRLLQIPAGTRITWKVTAWDNQPSGALRAWIQEMETELGKQ